MAAFLDGVAGNLLGKITEAASQSETWPVQIELRKLEITVSTLKSVLTDAEEKQANEPELALLLKQLRDSFSEAHDLIDELECEYLKRRVQNRRNDGEKLPCISSSSNFIVAYISRINKIRETLDKFEATVSKFNLAEKDNMHMKRLKGEMSLHACVTGSQVFARLLHLKRETFLTDNYDSIVGREKEKESIIDQLLMDGGGKEPFPIIAIYGIHGMGKTTLAKLVYNDDRVFTYFDKRMWVCLSEDFDVQRMRREILSCATGEQVIDALTEGQLRNRLQRNLIGRKFLLVLDDVGTLDSSRERELKEILKMGANGSRIIVTTGSEPILSYMILVHKIEKLDEKNSMELIKSAFENKNQTENFIKGAIEMVPKCDGVPLAIKCLAGVLSSKIKDAEWASVKDMSERWKVEEMKVLPALKLSFDLMPSYLKPCFLCFSFLPKDYVFYSYELIQLWMAQGILHSESSDKDPELVGEQYFNELWSCGFLEDVEEHALGYWFKIHSLVHDLAIQLAQKEQENSECLYRLSLVDSSNKDLPPSTSNKIRSLVVPVGGVEPKINGVSLFKCISKFKQLRILHLCNTSMEAIPTSIDALKHLRYLDLRGSRRIRRLPESICNLQSLQTLILAFCSELEELPKNIKNLISLRLLWITTKQTCLGKDGIGSLKSLRFLAIGGCANLTHLFEDIDKLNSLQTLIIYDCKSLLSLPEGLKTLTGLSNMAIWGCEQLKFTISLNIILGLKKLILKGFPASVRLPKWICSEFMQLDVLEIGDFPKVRTVPAGSFMTKVRILEISNCPRLRDFPRLPDLKELRVTFCGSLSKQCMDQRNHHELEISHVPYIYVDSRRIRGNKTPQPSTSNSPQTEEPKLEGS